MSQLLPNGERINPYHNSRRKRALDLLAAMPLRAVSLPLEKVSAMYLHHTLGDGEPYFYQERSLVGLNAFTMTKLRTMRHLGPTDKEIGYSQRNPRIPSFGARLLRLLRIDELPQLNSVLKKEMTMVSVRPIDDPTLEHFEDIGDPELMERLKHQIKINEVKPGLTGPAQIAHLVEDIRCPQSIDARLQADIAYVEEANLRTDIKLLCQTVGALTTKCVAKAAQEVTAPHIQVNN